MTSMKKSIHLAYIVICEVVETFYKKVEVLMSFCEKNKKTEKSLKNPEKLKGYLGKHPQNALVNKSCKHTTIYNCKNIK